jgi:predicted transcriptional regulator
MDDKKIGGAELRVLQHVEAHAPCTVREVANTLGAEMGVVRTTILQMMERLRTKGMLVRERGKGGWRYRPATSVDGVRMGAVRRFVREALGGSASPMVQYLSEADLSPDDLTALRALVDRLEDAP